ncbi:hypothetical protein PG984_002955 [Apiospora sp. TS-2023a]
MLVPPTIRLTALLGGAHGFAGRCNLKPVVAPPLLRPPHRRQHVLLVANTLAVPAEGRWKTAVAILQIERLMKAFHDEGLAMWRKLKDGEWETYQFRVTKKRNINLKSLSNTRQSTFQLVPFHGSGISSLVLLRPSKNVYVDPKQRGGCGVIIMNHTYTPTTNQPTHPSFHPSINNTPSTTIRRPFLTMEEVTESYGSIGVSVPTTFGTATRPANGTSSADSGPTTTSAQAPTPTPTPAPATWTRVAASGDNTLGGKE